MTFRDFRAPTRDFARRQNGAYPKMVSHVADIVPRDAAALEVAAGTADIGIAPSEKAKTTLRADLSGKMPNVVKRKAKRLTNIRFDIRGVHDLKRAGQRV